MTQSNSKQDEGVPEVGNRESAASFPTQVLPDAQAYPPLVHFVRAIARATARADFKTTILNGNADPAQ